MKKLLASVAAVFAVGSLSTGAVQAEGHACGEITMTEMNWASAQVIAESAKFILEQGYGCTVTLVPSSTVPSVTSLAETGKPEIITELWVNSTPAYEELEAEGRAITAGLALSDGGEEAWWIPQYLADKHPELTTLEGLMANADLAGGKFHNCPDGWGCRKVNDNLIKAWELDSAVEIFNHGSGETLAASIAAAFDAEEPWFGYYWAPTAILGKYPMAKVDMGPYVAEAHSCNTDQDCATPGKSAYPASRVLNVVSGELAAANPAVSEFMSNVSFDNMTMNGLLAWKDENNATSQETAVRFLTMNSDSWSTWINDDAKAKLAALIK